MTLPAPGHIHQLLAILVFWILAVPSHAQEGAAKLVLASGAVSAGDEIEIEVRMEDSGSRVSALTFVVDYDTTKLALDSADRVSFDLPSGFAGHAFPFPEEGRLGIAIYDPAAPLSVVGDGLLARVRFRVLPEAGETAAFTIEPSASAADRDAELVPLSVPVEPVAVMLPGSSASRRRIRPAAPSASEGSSGAKSEWRWAVPVVPMEPDSGLRSHLDLTNPSEQFALVDLVTAGGEDGPVHFRTRLGPGSSQTIDLSVLLRSSEGTPAAVVVTSDVGELGVRAAAEHSGTNPDLMLPAVRWEDLAAGGTPRTIAARELRGGEQLTVVLVNVGEESTIIGISVRDAHGDEIHREVVSAGAGMSTTVDLENLTGSPGREALLIELTARGSNVFGYATQRDRVTARPQIRIAQ